MKSYDLYAKLELITPEIEQRIAHSSKAHVKSQRVSRLFSALLQSVGRFFTNRYEPQVTRRCDRHGNAYYEVYDPTTGYTTRCASEQEVRAWLEQRYYLD